MNSGTTADEWCCPHGPLVLGRKVGRAGSKAVHTEACVHPGYRCRFIKLDPFWRKKGKVLLWDSGGLGTENLAYQLRARQLDLGGACAAGVCIPQCRVSALLPASGLRLDALSFTSLHLSYPHHLLGGQAIVSFLVCPFVFLHVTLSLLLIKTHTAAHS